jgi:hypothetical protein
VDQVGLIPMRLSNPIYHVTECVDFAHLWVGGLYPEIFFLPRLEFVFSTDVIKQATAAGFD